MALKLELDATAFEALPQEVKKEYRLTDDNKYRLDVEGGVVPKAKLDEFRNNNIELLKKLEPFKDVDPTILPDALKTYQQFKDKKLIDDGKINELVETRVVEMRNKYEGDTKKERDARIAAEATLSKVLIDNELTREALAGGALDTAVDDIVSRGRMTFKLQEGKVLPFDGERVIYGDDGVTPLSVKQWLTKLSAVAPHLFKKSTGGGADAGDRGGGGGGGTVAKKSDLKTATQKAQYIGKHGRDAYLKLPA